MGAAVALSAMAMMRNFLFAFAVFGVALNVAADKGSKAAKGKKPIVSMDMIYGTVELVSDVYTETRAQISKAAAPVLAPHIEKVSAMLPADPLGEVCGKVGMQKSEVLDKVSMAKDAAIQAKATAAVMMDRAYSPVVDAVEKLITAFEKKMPQYAGLVRKTVGDLVIFIVYALVVTYVVLRLALFAFRLGLSIFCCICCCGRCACCRQKHHGKHHHHKKHHSNGAKKGEAAAAAAAPAAAKAKGKNKK